MSRTLNIVLAGLSVVFVFILSGCGPTADLSLKFSPEEVAAYTVTTEVIKDFRFEQPNLGKLREEQTKTAVAMDFSQKTVSVDEDGNATIEVTIKGLSVDMTNKNEPKFAYDSTSEKDKGSPMSKLLGQSYTYRISPAGEVSDVNTSAAKAVVKTGFERKIAENILNEKSVIERHQVAALPDDEVEAMAVDATWSELVPSPPGLLAPKTYEKQYTLNAIESTGGDNIATVGMVATESAEDIKGASPMGGGSMGMFAKMFDNEDDYTGKLVLDLDTGKILSLEETLISRYIAQEMPENGDPDKGPDTLTMTFTNRIKVQKQD